MCVCAHVVNALDLRLTTNQSDGWQVPHKRTEIKQISAEIKQTFPPPVRALALRARRLGSRRGGCCGAPLAVQYVSFSGDSAATANEVLTWTDDKLLRGGGKKKRMSSVAGICSRCVLLAVLFNGISLSKLCARYADGICD